MQNYKYCKSNYILKMLINIHFKESVAKKAMLSCCFRQISTRTWVGCVLFNTDMGGVFFINLQSKSI